MKYIRTENHIYLIQKDISYGGNRIYKIYNHDFSITGNDFKVADTIEELCDEFVGVDKTCENGHQLLRAIPYKCANYWNGGVYGAIWTSKGLIYVAKMDSDGKLVLI